MRFLGVNITRGQVATEAKESAVGGSMVLNPGQPVWMDRNYKTFANEGYQKNVVVNRCVASIAEAIASVPLTYFRGDAEVLETPLSALMTNPNPMETYADYVQAVVGYLLISGNTYQEGVTASGAEVKELYALRPDRMKVIAGANGLPQGYCYEVGGRKTTWEVDVPAGIVPVYHTKLFNPIDDFYGLAPIESGAYAIDVHNQAMGYLQALLQNSARPSGALVAKDGETLSEENYNRLKTQMEEQYQGSANAGRPMLLEGGLDWKQMGMSPVDLEIIETKNSAARDICLAFGVPPMLIGLPGDNTYANYAEARLAFWEDTVIPLLTRIIGDWQTWLAGPVGLTIKPNLDGIPAIVERRAVLWASLQDSKVLTVNEKREAMGYEPYSGGDVIYIGMGEVPMGETFGAGDLPDVDAKALAEIAGYTTRKVVPIK